MVGRWSREKVLRKVSGSSGRKNRDGGVVAHREYGKLGVVECAKGVSKVPAGLTPGRRSTRIVHNSGL